MIAPRPITPNPYPPTQPRPGTPGPQPGPPGPTHPPRRLFNAATFATGVVMGFAIVWKLIPRRRVA